MGSLPPFDSPYSQPEEEKNFWGNEYVPKVRLSVYSIRAVTGGWVIRWSMAGRAPLTLSVYLSVPAFDTQLDHPGTMPPGTRLEDKPIEELSPVSNIPYPHFQEWPFHYR